MKRIKNLTLLNIILLFWISKITKMVCWSYVLNRIKYTIIIFRT